MSQPYLRSIFRVDTSTDSTHEDQVYGIWEQVDAADKKEVSQFIQEKAFKKVKRSDLGKDAILIDTIWVRKWKKQEASRVVKSRLCARGCHDPFKQEMSNRSTTATRLSQRLLVITATNKREPIESWDVAGAFLKGLTYDKLYKRLKELGIKTVERVVAIVVPANVWRHLGEMDREFYLKPGEEDEYALICLKPVYGLSEAPLAWQLYLHQCLAEMGAVQSVFDENYWVWRQPQRDDAIIQWPVASITTHVDDLAATAGQKWLDTMYARMVAKFGKLSRQVLPFAHCGCTYSRIADGYKIDQTDYVKMLKAPEIEKEIADDHPLNPQQVTQLRSVVGGLMWACVTRPDIMAELAQLQGIVTRACGRHLHQAKALVKRAQADAEACLIYLPLPRRHLRLFCIHDASAASSTKNYAQEGVVILLMADNINMEKEHYVADDSFAQNQLSGRAQLVYASSNKAKRISYSTSHGETLAAINGLENATLLSARFSEITTGGNKPSTHDLLAVQEHGARHFPVDPPQTAGTSSS